MPGFQMPEFRTLDAGKAIARGQDIKRSRIVNEMLGYDRDERVATIKNRAKAQRIREQYERTPEQIEQMEQQGLFEQADKLRQSYIQSKVSAVNLIKTMRQGINADNYKQFRQDMIQSGAITGELMPIEYSEKWWNEQEEKEKGDIKNLTRKWGEGGLTWAQDIQFQDGEVLNIGDKYRPSEDLKARSGGSGGGKPWQVTASDSNSIRSAVATYHGGTWDATTGQFKGLDKAQTATATSQAEEATRLYRLEQGQISHNEVAARAIRRGGQKVPNISESPDPAGILD